MYLSCFAYDGRLALFLTIPVTFYSIGRHTHFLSINRICLDIEMQAHIVVIKDFTTLHIGLR